MLLFITNEVNLCWHPRELAHKIPINCIVQGGPQLPPGNLSDVVKSAEKHTLKQTNKDTQFSETPNNKNRE